MSKLADTEVNFLKLIIRSTDRGDGWRQVSTLLWRLVHEFKPKELIEIDYDKLRVRLSERGKIVVEYLL